MKKKIILFIGGLIAMMLPSEVKSESFTDDLQAKVRVGYNLGGTAPVGLPEEIRSIDGFKLTPSVIVGIDVQKPLNDRWGLLTGLRFEGKMMNADITTKAYHMEVRKGNQKLDGLFTGKVHQEVSQWMFTIPAYVTYAFNKKLQLKAGPYISIVASNDFHGIASDGYLRLGDPTGAKIYMGNKEGEWATYEFNDDMRWFQIGMSAGIDWQFHRNIGLSVDLNWGLNGIFNQDFKTVDQTLFPIYGTIGFFYRIK